MAMGTRKDQEQQEEMWIPQAWLAKGVSHPFYQRLNQLLEESHFDEFVEGRCQRFYAKKRGRPSLVPGVYFRLLLIGYFEGIDSERGIAWRANDSLALRRFLRVGLEESPPDHSTISRTRRLMDVETHREVFTWVLGVLAEKGLLKGQTLGIDATMLEANAALRTIVRRDTGEGYQEFLKRLAQESGIATPTREQLARLDRKRARKGSNEEWEHPHDANRRRIQGERGKRLLRQRGEKLERSFAHLYETGGMRRVHLRRHPNILKRLLVHVAAFNLGLVMRQLLGRGTPRGLQGCPLDLLLALLRLLTDVWTRRLGSEGYGDRFEPNFGLSEPSNYTLLAIVKDAPSTTGC